MRHSFTKSLWCAGLFAGLLVFANPPTACAQRGGGGGGRGGGGGHMPSGGGRGHVPGGGGHMPSGGGRGHVPGGGHIPGGRTTRTLPRNIRPAPGRSKIARPSNGKTTPQTGCNSSGRSYRGRAYFWHGEKVYLVSYYGSGCHGGQNNSGAIIGLIGGLIGGPSAPPSRPSSAGGTMTTMAPWYHFPPANNRPNYGQFVPVNPVGIPLFAAPAAAVAARPMSVPINALPNRPRTQIVANASDTLLPIGYTPYVQLPSPGPLAAANTAADLLALPAGSPPDRAEELVSLVAEGLIAPPAHVKAKKMTGICLVNPIESGGAVGYLLNDTECSLRPGQVHQLPAGEYTIQFDKGDNHGDASYNLGERTYVFYNDAKKGWSLYSKAFQVTLDNSGNPNPFAGVLDGKQIRIEPRQSKKFKSSYPLLLAFDPGDGSEPARRWLTGSSYKVGIGVQTSLLDLFSLTQASAAGKATPARESEIE